jgi:hypothetical protein
MERGYRSNAAGLSRFAPEKESPAPMARGFVALPFKNG